LWKRVKTLLNTAPVPPYGVPLSRRQQTCEDMTFSAGCWLRGVTTFTMPAT